MMMEKMVSCLPASFPPQERVMQVGECASQLCFIFICGRAQHSTYFLQHIVGSETTEWALPTVHFKKAYCTFRSKGSQIV